MRSTTQSCLFNPEFFYMQSHVLKASAPLPAAQARPASGAKARLCLAAVVLAAAALPAARANGIGENGHWQFQTRADKTNQAAVQDMVQKRQNGVYAAPVYTTNIDRQYNCAVTASATGSSSTSNAVANSPSTSGASASSLGNQNTASVGYQGGNTASSTQGNSGAIGSSVNGSTSTSVRGTTTSQSLDTLQTNSGAQTASVGGSNACSFGALN